MKGRTEVEPPEQIQYLSNSHSNPIICIPTIVEYTTPRRLTKCFEGTSDSPVGLLSCVDFSKYIRYINRRRLLIIALRFQGYHCAQGVLSASLTGFRVVYSRIDILRALLFRL